MSDFGNAVENVFGQTAKTGQVGKVVDAVRRADYAIDTAQSNLAETVKKAMDNREKLTGLAGFFFGAKLDPRIETGFKILENSPKYAYLVAAAAFTPLAVLYAAAAAGGMAAGFLEGHFNRRKEEYKKEFEALPYDAEGIMQNADHFPENRFVREVMVDLLPNYLFDLGRASYDDKIASRIDIYNAGQFTEDPNSYTEASKEQKAYVKIRTYAAQEVIQSLGGNLVAAGLAAADVEEAINKSLENLRAGLPVNTANPKLGAIMGLTTTRPLTVFDLIGLYYNSASSAAESMVKSALQEKKTINTEAEEVQDRIAEEKAGEITRLTGIATAPRDAQDAVYDMLDLFDEADPQLAFMRYIGGPATPALALVTTLFNKFNQNADKLREYFFERPNGFIDLKIRELNRLAGNPYLDLGNPTVLDDQRSALMWLFSSRDQATLDVLVNPATTTIGIIARDLIEKVLGLPPATPTIDFGTHFKNFMNIAEGRDSSHYFQAQSYLINKIGFSQAEASQYLGADTATLLEKFNKEDQYVIAYLQFRALEGKYITLGNPSATPPVPPSFVIPGTDLDISAIPNARRTRPAPPYAVPITSEKELFTKLVATMSTMAAYDKKTNEKDKLIILDKMKDEDLALFALLHSQDPVIKRLVKNAPSKTSGTPPVTVLANGRDPATFAIYGGTFNAFASKKDLTVDTSLTEGMRKTMGNANFLDTYKVEPYSLLGLPAFESSADLKKPAANLLGTVAAADQLFNIEKGVLKPGVADLQKILDRMFRGGDDVDIMDAISGKFFPWLFALSNEQIDKIESGSYHEQWVYSGFSKFIRSIMNALNDAGISLRDFLNGNLIINGVKINDSHMDVMLLHKLKREEFFESFKKYKLQARSVQAYIDEQKLLDIHNKGLASYMRNDLENKYGVSEKDIENSAAYGSLTPSYVIDLPEPFERAGENGKIGAYVDLVEKKTTKLTKGFERSTTDPFGPTMGAAITHLGPAFLTGRISLESDLNTLVVDVPPDISSDLLYLYETYPTGARSWVDYNTFMMNPANDDTILDFLATNTENLQYNRAYLRMLRSGMNTLSNLYASGTFFRGAIDSPNVSAYELFSLLLGTFYTKGRESNLTLPNFGEIIADIGDRARRILTIADAQRLMQDIYVERMTPGNQLAHPEKSPLVIINKAVGGFKVDSKITNDSISIALSQRRQRLEAERKKHNPAPNVDGNQFVNLFRAWEGEKGNLSVREESALNW
jgi:hypothetical protein